MIEAKGWLRSGVRWDSQTVAGARFWMRVWSRYWRCADSTTARVIALEQAIAWRDWSLGRGGYPGLV